MHQAKSGIPINAPQLHQGWHVEDATWTNEICLHSRGLNKHFQNALMHDLWHYGGLGVGSLTAEHMEWRNSCTFLHHIWSKDKSCIQPEASLGYSQLEVGSQLTSFNHWNTLTKTTWITHLWQFLHEIGRSLQSATGVEWLSLPQQHGHFLIDIAMNSKAFTIQDCKQIIWCQVYTYKS